MINGRPVWGVLFCVTLVIASVATVFAGAGSNFAEAAPGSRSYSQHKSVLKVSSTGGGKTEYVQIGLNKSLMVELPRSVRDVMVSNPKMVDAVVHTSNRVHVIALEAGEANVFFFGHDGERILTLEVSISRDLRALSDMINRLIPASKIKLEAVNDNIVLTGSVQTPADSARASDIAWRFLEKSPNVDKSQKVLNLLSVAAREQVMLKVTIAEVNRESLKQFGVNMGAVIQSGRFNFTPLSGNAFPVNSGQFLANTRGVGWQSPGGVGHVFDDPGDGILQASGLLTGYSSGTTSIVKGLRIMERTGLLRTLAEPNLTAVSGETANFLAGGEFPIPVSNNNGAISIEFKKFGVGLAFTPVVMSGGRISLKIDAEASELTNEGAVVVGGVALSAIKVRRAKTTIELPSGGSMAIAGLISDNTRQNLDGTPGLKTLPILGSLFRSRDFARNETELVIIVTPYIVKPVQRAELSRPDDGLVPASDAKANFLGQLNRVYGGEKSDEQPVGKYRGDYGFIIE